MRDTDLFQLALGLQSPWTVTRSEFAVEDGRLDLYVDFPRGSRFACAECGVTLPVVEPQLFSFNSPKGACSVCHGLGVRAVAQLESIDDLLRVVEVRAVPNHELDFIRR